MLIKINLNIRFIRDNINVVKDNLIKECQINAIYLNKACIDKFNKYFEQKYNKNKNVIEQLGNEYNDKYCWGEKYLSQKDIQELAKQNGLVYYYDNYISVLNHYIFNFISIQN